MIARPWAKAISHNASFAGSRSSRSRPDRTPDSIHAPSLGDHRVLNTKPLGDLRIRLSLRRHRDPEPSPRPPRRVGQHVTVDDPPENVERRQAVESRGQAPVPVLDRIQQQRTAVLEVAGDGAGAETGVARHLTYRRPRHTTLGDAGEGSRDAAHPAAPDQPARPRARRSRHAGPRRPRRTTHPAPRLVRSRQGSRSIHRCR